MEALDFGDKRSLGPSICEPNSQNDQTWHDQEQQTDCLATKRQAKLVAVR